VIVRNVKGRLEALETAVDAARALPGLQGELDRLRVEARANEQLERLAAQNALGHAVLVSFLANLEQLGTEARAKTEEALRRIFSAHLVE
jgi:hypothetical protein